MTDKQIYQIGLTMINGVGDILARQLLQSIGDAEAIFTEKQVLLEKIPGIGNKLAAEIKHPDVLKRAEKEMRFIEKNQISYYFFTDTSYPARLKECPDAPILFYFKGNTNLNNQRIISVVGTRTPTEYGKELVQSLLQDLSVQIPDVMIVSGLAYGIDICAHQQALKNHLPTVAVLAHGLDRIYPSCHRNTAIQMLEQGGLLTDFPSGTNPDRPNFLCRNRIIAGLSDCTIVIESAEKGGSLVTADIAFSYGRDVYCFPGRVNDRCSKGCNELIRKNKAGLITSADDLLSALCWDVSTQPIQTELSFTEEEESNEQHPILQLLKKQESMHINQLASHLRMSIQQISTLLFDLEMEGKIKSMPGNMYKRL
ncbi:MAG: DNA-processing protein DprA [Parabacteroides sp.]|nr:DNA-processing protein DprA [Parabacteroides sp.]